jgi:hypothetical protein
MRNSNFLQFESISELMKELDNAPVIPDRETASERSCDSDWCDTKTYQEAHDAIINGRMYDNIPTDLNKYRTKGCKEKNSSYLDVVGFAPVVPLALQNVPNCMVNKKKTINNKIVTIVYNCSTPCHVSSSRIMQTTAELMRNIIELEKDGYRVNLYVCEYNENDGGFGFVLKLKTDREILNIKKLCFPLVSSSFLRRIAFRICERLYKDWIGSGYGRATFNEEGVKKLISNTIRLQHYECWNYEGKQFSV